MAVGKLPAIGLACLLIALAATTLGTLYHSHQLSGRVKKARLSTSGGLDSTTARLYVDAELEPPAWSIHQIVPQGARCVLHTKALDVIAEVDGVTMAPIGMAMTLEATVHAATVTQAAAGESPELECIFSYAINFFQSGLLVERSATATWRLPSGSRGLGSAAVERRGPVAAVQLPKGAVELHQEAMLRVNFPASSLAEDLMALLQDAELSLESHVAYTEATSGAFKVQKNVSAPVHLVADGRGGCDLAAPFNASALIDFPKLATLLAGVAKGKVGPAQQRPGGAVRREVRVVAEDQSSLVAKVLGPSHTLGWRSNEASSGRTMAKQLAQRIGAALLGEAAAPAEGGRLLSSNPAGLRDEMSIVFDETIYNDDKELDINIKITGDIDMDSMDIEASVIETEEGSAPSTFFSAKAGLSHDGEAMKMELSLDITGGMTAMVDISFTELYSMSCSAWLKDEQGQMLGELQGIGKSVGGSDDLAISITSDIFEATFNLQEADEDVSNNLHVTVPGGSTLLNVTGSGTRDDRKADLKWVIKYDNNGTLEQLCRARIFTSKSDDIWFSAGVAMWEHQGEDARLQLEIENKEGGDLSLESFDLGASFEIEQPGAFNYEESDVQGLPCLTGGCRLGISSHGPLWDGPADVVASFSSEDRHQDELMGGGLTLHHSEGRLELVGDAREEQEPVLLLKAEAHDMLLEASASLLKDPTFDFDLRVAEVEAEKEPADAYELELKVEANGSVVLVANASTTSGDAGGHAKLEFESSDVALNGLFKIHNNGSDVKFADFDTSLDLDMRSYNVDGPCGSFTTLRAAAWTIGGSFNASASVATDSEESAEECQMATWLDVEMAGTNADGVIDAATASGDDATHGVKLKITQLSEDEYGVSLAVDDAVEFTGRWQDKNYSVVVDILDPAMRSTTQVLLTDKYVAASMEGNATDDVTVNVSYNPTDAAIPGFKEVWFRGHMAMKEGNATTVDTNVTMLLTPEEGIYDVMLKADMYEMHDAVKDYVFALDFDAQMPYAAPDQETGTKQVATIEGSITMSVEDPEAFISDENAQASLKESIAHFAGNGVSADDVVLVFSYEAARRRLLGAPAAPAPAGRRMAGVVDVDYTIKAESSEEEVVDFEAIKDNLEQVTPAEMTTTCTDFLKEALGEEAASAYNLAVTEMAPPTMTLETIDTPDSDYQGYASVARGMQGEPSRLLPLAALMYLLQSLRREAAL